MKSILIIVTILIASYSYSSTNLPENTKMVCLEIAGHFFYNPKAIAVVENQDDSIVLYVKRKLVDWEVFTPSLPVTEVTDDNRVIYFRSYYGDHFEVQMYNNSSFTYNYHMSGGSFYQFADVSDCFEI